MQGKQSIFITLLETLLASSDQFDKLSAILNSASANYQMSWSSKALSLAFCMYTHISISGTRSCSPIWDILLILVIRIIRKAQLCSASWSAEPGNGAGQITTIISREIHWPFLHRVRQAAGLLTPAPVRSTPRNWRAGEAEEVAVEAGESPVIPSQGEPPWHVSAQQVGTPLGVLAHQGTAQLWGISAFEQQKAKGFKTNKHTNTHKTHQNKTPPPTYTAVLFNLQVILFIYLKLNFHGYPRADNCLSRHFSWNSFLPAKSRKKKKGGGKVF